MKTKRITRSWLKNNGACYSDYRLRKLVPKEGVTLQQVLETDQIPDADKLWVATRDGVLPQRIAAAWMAGIVERALGRIPNPDPRSLAIVPLLRRISAGERVSQVELVAAMRAVQRVCNIDGDSEERGRRQQIRDLLTLLED